MQFFYLGLKKWPGAPRPTQLAERPGVPATIASTSQAPLDLLQQGTRGAMAARELQEDINVERGLRTQVLGTSRAAKAGAGVVPVIDMSESPETVTEAMWNAASTVGFFTLKNHGISQAAIEEAFAASADFFAQEQPAKKEQSPFAAHLCLAGRVVSAQQ